MFNATYNHISAIWWQSVLLVEETGEIHEFTKIYSDVGRYKKCERDATMVWIRCMIPYPLPWHTTWMLKIWRVYDLPYKYFSPQIGTFYGLVFGLILWGLRHFQQYFSYIVAISFIGGGNRKIRRKPPTCRKLLTNFSHNVVLLALSVSRTHNISGDIGTDCIGSCKSNYHTTTSTTALPVHFM